MARHIKLEGYKIGPKNEGRLHFPTRDRVTQFSNSLGDGVRVIMEIREDESELIKSNRGYYFGVVVKHVAIAMRDVAGYLIDPDSKTIIDAIHDWCKKEFLENSIVVPNSFGDSVTLPPSTTRLDDDGWKDYISKIVIFTAEVWSYVIPNKVGKFYFPTDEPEFITYKHLQSQFKQQP